MDKAIVTNSAVSEPAQNNQPNPTGEGKSPAKEADLITNLRAEFARKTSELHEKFEAGQKELAELKEKVRLTESEKRRVRSLEDNADDLEFEIHKLETDPSLRAYNAKIERSFAKAKEDAKFEMSVEAVNDFIAEKSEELGIDSTVFQKELDALCKSSWSSLQPHQRVKKAFKEWKEKNEIAKERESLKAEREKLNIHSEGAGKTNLFSNYQEAKLKGSVIDRVKALGQYRRD